jgi:signal transduction histidine kinase
VTVGRKLGGLAGRLRHPKTTVRWRLTLLYGGLFLVCGAALLAVTYALVARDTLPRVPNFVVARRGSRDQVQVAASAQLPVPPKDLPPGVTRVLGSPAGRAAVKFVGTQQRIADLHRLEVKSAIALAIMAIISALLGWVVAGRVLLPLRTITATTRQISDVNLHQRLALAGPRDEVRTLADTIDGLLERLQASFEAQRRFVANASHELRTPLTASRALLEMVLSDPQATVATFREVGNQVLEESEQQEQLIDALLALAQGQRGIHHRESLDLAVIAGQVIRTHERDAVEKGMKLELSLTPAPFSGDRRLIERLVANLLQNAIRHNSPDGEVSLRVETKAGAAFLMVANTGPQVPADEVQRLLQPFQRLRPDRVGHDDGLGLGLSIVAAVAAAHNATLDVQPRVEGGLEVEVRFPHEAGSNGRAAPREDSRLPRPATEPSPAQPRSSDSDSVQLTPT